MCDVRVAAKTGTYVGKLEDGIREYLGIRFAKPVKLWEMPEYPDTTEKDVIKVQEYAPSCIQPVSPDEPASLGAMSTDCLTLNIWTKDNDVKGKPVMLYIHGGSYVNGGNNDPITCGKGFIEQLPEGEDVVIVKINYRVGIFGCFDLSVLEGYSSKYENSTVLHLVDQIAALKWTNENIEAFGGDPNNVTLFGQSAGSMSIAYLMAHEEARKYFKRGIMQSGVPFFGIATKEAKNELAKNMFADLGIKSIEDLAKTDDAFWIKAYEDYFGKYAGAICPRVCDDKYIKDDYWKEVERGNAKNISLMIGATSGEMDMNKYNLVDPSKVNTADDVLDFLYSMFDDTGNAAGQLTPLPYDDVINEYIESGEDNLKRALNVFGAFATQMGSMIYANCQSKWRDTYCYSWNWMPDATLLSKSGQKVKFSDWGRALHCGELPVLFNSGDAAYPALSTWWLFFLGDDLKESVDKDIVPEELVKKTVMTWYSFAKTGDPNNALIPEWKPYDEKEKNMMLMDSKWALKTDILMEDSHILMKIQPTEAQDDSLTNNRKSVLNVHAMDR